MMCNSGQDPSEEADYLDLFAEQRVRGVLITPTDSGGANLDRLRRNGIPQVFVDRYVAGGELCSVSVDDVAGGTLAVGHLVAAGHTQIVYVSGPSSLAQCRDRRVGAEAAIAEAGLPPSALSVIEVERLDVSAGRDAGSRVLGLAERPTAIFCANDLIALGMLQAMFAAGVRVPEQMSLVGYDDIEFAAAAAVPLTSVRQPAFRIGRTAADLLIAETAENSVGHVHQQVVFQPELVVRQSSLPARR
jgi:LacI family transcriptional regulator